MNINKIDNISKLLVDNINTLPNLQRIDVTIFIKNVRNLRDSLILKAYCSLELLTSQKPSINSYKMNYNYKEHSFNFYSKVNLTNKKRIYSFLNLYKFIIFSEMLLNHLYINMYDSFNLKNLTIIPYIDESYYKISYAIKIKVNLKTNLFFSKFLVGNNINIIESLCVLI